MVTLAKLCTSASDPVSLYKRVNVLYTILIVFLMIWMRQLRGIPANCHQLQLLIICFRPARKIILQKLLRLLTANEQKWFVRIILKGTIYSHIFNWPRMKLMPWSIELKIGMSDKSVLNFFHPDAQLMYDTTNSLRKVCELVDPTARVNVVRIFLMMFIVMWFFWPAVKSGRPIILSY